jgi:UDPglucose 6-dehydrogenase
MNVRVLGDGLLAKTTHACLLPYFSVDGEPDILWVCYDTPVTDDVPDSEWVLARIAENLPATSALILISSQVPVGFCAEAERRHPHHTFAVSPENIRRSSPVDDFCNQSRVIIGAAFHDYRLKELFAPFCQKILWMSAESAEMVKHVLNGYLAMCIAYANEIGDICDLVNADREDVFAGFRADSRVSQRAPLTPGGPYTGGTLGRDIHVLSELGAGPLIPAVNESNRRRL